MDVSNGLEGVSLKAIVAGFLQAVTEAKRLGDLESARLAEVYRSERNLASFTVPAFTISDMDIELRFAVVGSVEPSRGEEPPSDITVNVSPDLIQGLEAHQVSSIRLRVSPVNLRVFEGGS